MKASELADILCELIKEHGDLEVKGNMSVPRTTRFGPVTIALKSTTNYATPKPYEVTEHFEVRHVDFVEDK